MIDLFFCYRYRFAEVASWIGYEAGTRADQYENNFEVRSGFDDELDISFVDNDFEDPDPEKLLDVSRTVDADYVVLPDIFDADSLDEILRLGATVESEGRTPIVVPKTEFDFTDIPDEWIMGYSVPSGYGETDVPIDEFTDHDVHLLGGSPRNQFECAASALQHNVSIVSADTNCFGSAASYGNVVNYPEKMFDDDGKAWLYDVDGYDEWSGRVVVSLVHYYETWRQWCQRTDGYAV